MKKTICIMLTVCIFIGLCGCNYETVRKFVPQKLAEQLNLYYFCDVPNGESIGTMDGEPLVKGIISEDDERLDGLYYYNLLDDNTKYIYRVLLWTAESFTENWVDITAAKNHNYTLFVAYRALINDFPEYFWIPSAYSISADSYHNAVSFYKSGECKVNAAEASEMLDEFNGIAATILERVNEKDDVFTKELYLHDAVCKLCTYTQDGEYPYSAYGALVQGEAVCEGYARAFYYLCKKAGIECLLVNGISRDEGHIWNMVKLPDGWYNVDVTWDDTDFEPAHGYFNISDEVSNKDHTEKPLLEYMPNKDIEDGETFNFINVVTEGDAYNYYNYYGLVINSTDTKRTADEIVRRYEMGNSTAQLLFANEKEFNKYEDNYENFVIETQKYINKSLGNGIIKLKTVASQGNSLILHWENQ